MTSEYGSSWISWRAFFFLGTGATNKSPCSRDPCNIWSLRSNSSHSNCTCCSKLPYGCYPSNTDSTSRPSFSFYRLFVSFFFCAPLKRVKEGEMMRSLPSRCSVVSQPCATALHVSQIRTSANFPPSPSPLRCQF